MYIRIYTYEKQKVRRVHPLDVMLYTTHPSKTIRESVQVLPPDVRSYSSRSLGGVSGSG